jgi:hypothetical protein
MIALGGLIFLVALPFSSLEATLSFIFSNRGLEDFAEGMHTDYFCIRFCQADTYL